MTKIRIEYLQANGRIRRETAHTESQWPNFLINHHDKQAHSLMDSPVFPMERKPRQFATWEELLVAEAPDPVRFPDQLVAVCEDQNIWPICGNSLPDIQDRQMQFKEFAQDAEQNGVAMATRDAQGSAIMAAWSIVSLMVFSVISVIIVLFVLQSKLASDLINGALPAASIINEVITGTHYLI